MRGTINYKDGRKEYSPNVILDARKVLAFKSERSLSTVISNSARVKLADGTEDVCFKNFRVNITPDHTPLPRVKFKGREYEIVILRD